MNTSQETLLRNKARRIRYLIADEIGTLGTGHIGGSLSVVETLVVLYERHMRINPADPSLETRDRFVMSKGHAGPALYAVLADKGYFSLDELHTLNKPDTILPSHCDMRLTPGIDMTAGSLGQGISCAVGIALGMKLRGQGARVYAVLGDGESQEGQVWEAAMCAAQQKLDNLIAFTDNNEMQLDGRVEDICSVSPLMDKWRAFGWYVQETDGHDVMKIDACIERAKLHAGSPSMIILHTVKGKGLSQSENAPMDNHSMTFTKEQHAAALRELEGGAEDAGK